MLTGWLAGIGLYAVVVGLLADTFSSASISRSLEEQLRSVGALIVTPKGALGFYFLMFVFAISLFACAQVLAAPTRKRIALETLFAARVRAAPGSAAGCCWRRRPPWRWR